jgi:ABC-type transport system substrate-binding protein
MGELRRLLERMAQRGTPSGPDAVLAEARKRAAVVMSEPRRVHRRPLLLVAAVAAAIATAVVGTVWGASFANRESHRGDVSVGRSSTSVASPATARPVGGGQLRFGVDAETPGGWCLPEAQLSASGIEVASAIYDTLTVPANDGHGGVTYVPSLARSVVHDASFTRWTIALRDGITFHDGEALTASAVAQNLDAYRAGPLFGVALADVRSITVVDRLTVQVATRVPWVAFPATLWSSGRMGIAAPAQLADHARCATHPIGTGPFRFVVWHLNHDLIVERNSSYWQRDSEGRRLPYLDRIVFSPLTDAAARSRALESGSVDAVMTDDPGETSRLQAARAIHVATSAIGPDVVSIMFNVSKAPFDNLTARRALAAAIDPDTIIRVAEHDAVTRAVEPFPVGVPGHVAPTVLGIPTHDPTRARELVNQYERDTGTRLAFDLVGDNSAGAKDVTNLIAHQARAAGMVVSTRTLDPATQINAAIGGDYDAMLWSTSTGSDPDVDAIWWQSTTSLGANPVNFGHLHDGELDQLLAAGRSQPDPPQRDALYEAATRRLTEQLYHVWLWYDDDALVTTPRVHGTDPPTLPDGSAPVVVSGVHPVVGLWRDH